jgi:hypothetical protein
MSRTSIGVWVSIVRLAVAIGLTSAQTAAAGVVGNEAAPGDVVKCLRSTSGVTRTLVLRGTVDVTLKSRSETSLLFYRSHEAALVALRKARSATTSLGVRLPKSMTYVTGKALVTWEAPPSRVDVAAVARCLN